MRVGIMRFLESAVAKSGEALKLKLAPSIAATFKNSRRLIVILHCFFDLDYSPTLFAASLPGV